MKKKKKKNQEEMHQDYLECVSLLTKLLNNDFNKAVKWMKTENEVTFNRAPIEIVFSGEGDELIRYLKTRLGIAPGYGF